MWRKLTGFPETLSLMRHADLKLAGCVRTSPSLLECSIAMSHTNISQVVMTATGGLMGGQQIFRKDESSTGCVIKYSEQLEIRCTDYISVFPAIPEDW